MKRYSLIACCLVLGGFAGAFLSATWLNGQAPVAPVLAKELTSYRDVVKKVLPAVVSIESSPAKVAPRSRRRAPAPLDDDIPQEFRRFFELPNEGDAPQPRGGFGSGVLVEAKGVILTNFHVVDGAEKVTVHLSDGRKFTSKDVKTDPKTDLAIVRIEAPAALPFLELGDSDAMEIGDRVLAVGAPFGLTGTVTHGIISAKDRSLQLNMYEDFIQTDAAINPGNSGGPLVSLDGKIIGINAAIKTRSGGWQGVGLAVSSNLAKNIMPQLLKDGVVRRGYLGVQIKDINESAEVAERLGLKQGERGVQVTRVFEDTPGAKAGLKGGDVITALDGKPIRNGHQLQIFIARQPVGKTVEVRLLRDGQPQTLQVKIEEQPRKYGTVRVPLPRPVERNPDSIAVEKIGVKAVDLTEDVADRLGYKEQTQGAVLARVDRDGLAANADLRPGTLITKVDKKPIKSAKDLRDVIDAASLERGVLLQVETPQGGTNFVLLKSSKSGK